MWKSLNDIEIKYLQKVLYTICKLLCLSENTISPTAFGIDYMANRKNQIFVNQFFKSESLKTCYGARRK